MGHDRRCASVARCKAQLRERNRGGCESFEALGAGRPFELPAVVETGIDMARLPQIRAGHELVGKLLVETEGIAPVEVGTVAIPAGDGLPFVVIAGIGRPARDACRA